jgi:hypothetical protein
LLHELEALTSRAACALQVGHVARAGVRDEVVLDSGYAAHALGGEEDLAVFPLQHVAVEHDTPSPALDLDRARVARHASELGAHALGDDVVILMVISAQPRPHLSGNSMCPVRNVARRNVRSLGSRVRRVHELVAQESTPPPAGAVVEKIG